MTNNPFKFKIAIFDTDIDHLKHVNNASYIKWIQKAVVAHWECHSTPALQATNLWIALRHEIDYLKQSFLTDDLVVEIVIREIKTVRVTYQSVIKRGEEMIATALSTWCCIHPDTHRPKRISLDILNVFSER